MASKTKFVLARTVPFVLVVVSGVAGISWVYGGSPHPVATLFAIVCSVIFVRRVFQAYDLLEEQHSNQ